MFFWQFDFSGIWNFFQCRGAYFEKHCPKASELKQNNGILYWINLSMGVPKGGGLDFEIRHKYNPFEKLMILSTWLPVINY